MFTLLSDMLRRGHPADILWFLAGAWLLLLFLGLIFMQLWRRLRGRGKAGQNRPGGP